MRLSENFDSSEFRCSCCGLFIRSDILILALERVRVLMRRPILISSGTRCEDWNREVGGKPTSRHLHGLAADVPTYDKEDKYDLVYAAMRAGVTDIGVYDWGIHIGVETPFGLWRGR